MKQSKPHRTSRKTLTAIQTSRHFHVSHHKHSGHVLPHKHTSYPMLAMVVLCVGVLLFTWTRLVTADTFVYPGPQQNQYVVHASVPGPAPTLAASIDDPIDGDVFTDVPITVTGSCPLDTYVSLSRNNVFSGVAICDADGTYTLKTGLFKGVNALVATVHSQTDVPGPVSNTVNVTYNPPEPPPVIEPTEPAAPNEPSPDSPTPTAVSNDSSSKPATGNTKKSTANKAPAKAQPVATESSPLVFKTNYTYTGVYTGHPTNWQLELEGGTAPYAVGVDWGDGTSSVLSKSQAGTFNLEHLYKKAGKYKGSYTVVFTATDASGTKTYLQLLAIVNNPPLAGGSNTGTGGGIVMNVSPAYLENILKYVWPGYGVVLLMLTSFWLGERREFKYLRPRLKKTHHQHV